MKKIITNEKLVLAKIITEKVFTDKVSYSLVYVAENFIQKMQKMTGNKGLTKNRGTGGIGCPKKNRVTISLSEIL